MGSELELRRSYTLGFLFICLDGRFEEHLSGLKKTRQERRRQGRRVCMLFLIQNQNLGLLNISPLIRVVYRFEWCLFTFSILWTMNGCHGRCWL